MSEQPLFDEGTIAPMKLVRIQEVFHPSAGRGHSHFFYEFEPDMEQAALARRKKDPSPTEDTYNGDEFFEQRGAIGQLRLGLNLPHLDLCVGDLFDIVLVPRKPVEVPDLSESALGKVLARMFGGGGDFVMIPPQDLEAIEYDLPPDIEGLPDLTHIDAGTWMNMGPMGRLRMIAEAREEQG